MQKIPVKPVEVQPAQAPKSMYEKRKKIYIREVQGFFQKTRSLFLMLLMVMYFGVAWISWGGKQLVWFDLPARQFHIFGATFWPQDFMLLSGMLIICAYGLFTITNFAGRIWCGYSCPQTAWSFIFVWIEEKIEGTRNQRIKLDKQKMDFTKFRKKATKHLLWILVALATGITFVGYFSPIRDLIPNLVTLNAGHWEYFWIGFFLVATYVNAGFMREQVCIYMCPYARFQSVMYDADTLAVTYDFNRGEPRGKKRKKSEEEQKPLGDCVDCSLCVQVCPTGIDIRDGMQYQCIACALCIDACNSVMDKLERPKGLIRYATENEIEGGKTHIFRPRLVGYASMLILMISVLSYAIISRTPFELDIERDRGSLYRITPDDTVQNSYTLKLMNMSQMPQQYEIRVEGIDNLIFDGEKIHNMSVNKLKEVPVNIEVDPSKTKLKSSRTDIEFIVINKTSNEEVAREESRFIAPMH